MTDNGPHIIDTDGIKKTEGHIQTGRLRGALDTESCMKATRSSVQASVRLNHMNYLNRFKNKN